MQKAFFTFRAFTKLYDKSHNQFLLGRVLMTAEQIVLRDRQVKWRFDRFAALGVVVALALSQAFAQSTGAGQTSGQRDSVAKTPDQPLTTVAIQVKVVVVAVDQLISAFTRPVVVN